VDDPWPRSCAGVERDAAFEVRDGGLVSLEQARQHAEVSVRDAVRADRAAGRQRPAGVWGEQVVERAGGLAITDDDAGFGALTHRRRPVRVERQAGVAARGHGGELRLSVRHAAAHEEGVPART
jgi:hypothetical protein